MQPQVKISVSVLVAVKEKNGIFLANCPYLNIISQGPTEEEAVAQLRKEMGLLFETCIADKTLEAVLDRRTSEKMEPFSPKDFVSVSRRYVDLPPEIPPEILKRFTDASAALS